MSNSEKQWPQYQCHKIVGALKIKDTLLTGRNEKNELTTRISFYDDGFEPIMVTPDFIKKHEPRAGGYLIKHENGRMSFYLPDAFMKDYTRIPSRPTGERRRIVPIWSEMTKHNFVDVSLVKPRKFRETSDDLTSVLKIDSRFSLLSTSQTDTDLEQGLIDTTDSISVEMAIDRVYLEFQYETSNKTTASRVVSFAITENNEFEQSNMRELTLAKIWELKWDTDCGSFLYEVNFFGTCNLELGDFKATAFVSSGKVLDSNGNPKQPHEIQKNITISSARLIGYDLEAYRVNYNRIPR